MFSYLYLYKYKTSSKIKYTRKLNDRQFTSQNAFDHVSKNRSIKYSHRNSIIYNSISYLKKNIEYVETDITMF